MKNNPSLSGRRLFVVLCTAASVCMSSVAAAFFLNNSDPAAPAMSPFSKNDVYGAVVTFSPEDFTNRVSSGAELEGIVISSLPEKSSGVLKLGGRDLLRGEGISADSLSALRFVPASEGEVSAVFSVTPVFSGDICGTDSIPVTVNLTENAGSAPIAENLRFETYPGIAICGKFKASDPDGDPLTFKILDAPKTGECVIQKDGFRYTPGKDQKGEDTFTYVASDDKGNTSAPAKVIVSVLTRREKDAVFYADMENHSAHYAAVRLSEMGVMTGAQIGNSYFLNPSLPVNRSEFVAMAVAASEISVPAAALNTGLADDSEIEEWAKPYVSAALNAGIIKGALNESGERVFMPKDTLTRAEAAVILNNLADITDTAETGVFSDEQQIPVWALQASANVSAANIICPVDGVMMPSAPVTRADASQMLYDTVCLMEQKSDKNEGLFAWAGQRK